MCVAPHNWDAHPGCLLRMLLQGRWQGVASAASLSLKLPTCPVSFERLSGHEVKQQEKKHHGFRNVVKLSRIEGKQGEPWFPEYVCWP